MGLRVVLGREGVAGMFPSGAKRNEGTSTSLPAVRRSIPSPHWKVHVNPSLDDYATDLLRHLGIHVHRIAHSKRDGSLHEEIHVYSQPTHMNHVLGWRTRQPLEPAIRIFEGPPPPW